MKFGALDLALLRGQTKKASSAKFLQSSKSSITAAMRVLRQIKQGG
jgi:hypothetical protein